MNSTEHIEYVNSKLTGQPWMQDKNCVKSRTVACRSRASYLHKLSLPPCPFFTFHWLVTLLERKTFKKGLLQAGWFLAESASLLLNWFLHLPPHESLKIFLIEHALNLQDMLVQKRNGWDRQQIHPVSVYNNDDEVFYILEMNGYLICVNY